MKASEAIQRMQEELDSDNAKWLYRMRWKDGDVVGIKSLLGFKARGVAIRGTVMSSLQVAFVASVLKMVSGDQATMNDLAAIDVFFSDYSCVIRLRTRSSTKRTDIRKINLGRGMEAYMVEVPAGDARQLTYLVLQPEITLKKVAGIPL